MKQVSRFTLSITVDPAKLAARWPNYALNYDSPDAFVRAMVQNTIAQQDDGSYGLSIAVTPEPKPVTLHYHNTLSTDDGALPESLTLANRKDARAVQELVEGMQNEWPHVVFCRSRTRFTSDT